jgi:hypothetical protein
MLSIRVEIFGKRSLTGTWNYCSVPCHLLIVSLAFSFHHSRPGLIMEEELTHAHIAQEHHQHHHSDHDEDHHVHFRYNLTFSKVLFLSVILTKFL